MSLKQTIYFMALVGGLAGLVCFAIITWFDQFEVQQESFWILGMINAAILGMFIGGLTVLFADLWSGGQVVARWVVSGAFVGLLAGALSGLLHSPIGNVLVDYKFLAIVASWMVSGALIGFGTGLRWAGVNKLRVLHALGGGMFGGIVGGLVFALSSGGTPQLADLFRALSFMVTGVGITCGVTLAPVLLRDGLLRFISSGDARAQNKYGPTRKEWELQAGDSYLAGSMGADRTSSMYGQEVQIYIPDAMVNLRHAVIAGRSGQFFIEQHPENRGPQGQPLYPLQLRGQDINMPQQLRNGDDIVIGQTLLRFETRKQT